MESSTSGRRDSMSDEYSGNSSSPPEKIVFESSPQRRSEKQSEHGSDMANATPDDRSSLSSDHFNWNLASIIAGYSSEYTPGNVGGESVC